MTLCAMCSSVFCGVLNTGCNNYREMFTELDMVGLYIGGCGDFALPLLHISGFTTHLLPDGRKEGRKGHVSAALSQAYLSLRGQRIEFQVVSLVS